MPTDEEQKLINMVSDALQRLTDQIATLGRIVDKQNERIESQAKEIELVHETLLKLSKKRGKKWMFSL